MVVLSSGMVEINLNIILLMVVYLQITLLKQVLDKIQEVEALSIGLKMVKRVRF